MGGPFKKGSLLPRQIWVSELSDFWGFFLKFLNNILENKTIPPSLWHWSDLPERNAVSANRALWLKLWIQNEYFP